MNFDELTALTQLGIGAFEKMLSATSGFRQRKGQHDMATLVAQTLARADLGENPAPQKAIAVIQAGTGVGKSAAYASTAIALALQRKTRVLISTATVALQEQLMHKDLPLLAKSLGQHFVFALAKGRGRYVCKIKLEQRTEFGGGSYTPDFAEIETNTTPTEEVQQRRIRLFQNITTAFEKGQWDGDRDTLTESPEAGDWASIAAERHTCTVRHCPRFRDCSYYEARAKLVDANVIVANHDLVLSSLGMKTLPDLDKCLVIFDEGHHLPSVALDQFASSMDLSNLRWLDRLPKTLTEVATALALKSESNVIAVSQSLKAVLTQLARMGRDRGALRFPHGVLPDELHEPVLHIATQAGEIAKVLEALATEIKTLAKDDPSRAAPCAQHYASLGALSPRLNSFINTANLLLEHGEQPLAKWFQVEDSNNYLTLTLHASPIVPGDLLRQFLWSQVRGAIVTSASLTSCGSFDYFLREAGLLHNPNVEALEVSSPFDYASQGTFTIVHTQAEPKQADDYNREMVQALLHDIAQVPHGALVLFTSKAQMRVATEALPPTLQGIVWVQGSQSRTRLLAAHQARVEAGLPSIIFGMQSFGEGLDLPGTLCETVFIAKLPFAPPTEPVDEARAEWLRSVGRDPFSELVIPATGIKLLQWTGRAIRTEEDQAAVVCYDKRLIVQSYGRRMLAGLPPYRVLERK
ncbi:MAG: hypothetical protein RIR79_645 [Pseudomonadota bacterium]|jgi:ATP-dependent DNA helicase DinG